MSQNSNRPNRPPLTPEERERRRRRAIAKQKRRRKRKIQRALLIIAMLLILLLIVLVVRSAIRGIKKHSQEKKAKAEAVELQKKEEEAPTFEEADAVITTVGDVVLHSPFLESSYYYNGESYNFDSIFTYMKDAYEAADFTVITPEFALTEGDYSGYPTFHAPDAIADAFKNNGIDMCLLANNHIFDAGEEGLQRTMDVYEQKGLLYTGTRKSASDKNYVVQEINGIKVGFFNYVFETEEVDGYKTINGIAISKEGEQLVNSFSEANPQSLYDEVDQILAAMKDEGVEYTIAYMHWGVEYQLQENQYQDAVAQALCDKGVDALIASHPHVIQPVDLLTSSDGQHQMICAYAIGNHLSNQRTEYMEGYSEPGYTEDGMYVTLTIHRDTDGTVTTQKADFVPTWVYLDNSGDANYLILPLYNPDAIKESSGLSFISDDIEASIARTNGIVGEGVAKVQAALPITADGAERAGTPVKVETFETEQETEDTSSEESSEESSDESYDETDDGSSEEWSEDDSEESEDGE